MLWQPQPFDRWEGKGTDRNAVIRWVELVHRLPEVRLDKVAAVREALRRHIYDDSRIFEVAIDRLSREAGIR